MQLAAVSHPSFLLLDFSGDPCLIIEVDVICASCVVQTSLYASSTMCVSVLRVTISADNNVSTQMATDGNFLHVYCRAR